MPDAERTEEAHNTWIRRILRYMLWLLVVGTVLMALTYKAAGDLDDSVGKLEGTTQEAKKAAAEARDELRAAIRRIEAVDPEQPSLNNQDIVNALAAIARIEDYLCGGPCPAEGE
jgi:hypothetical protein